MFSFWLWHWLHVVLCAWCALFPGWLADCLALQPLVAGSCCLARRSHSLPLIVFGLFVSMSAKQGVCQGVGFAACLLAGCFSHSQGVDLDYYTRQGHLCHGPCILYQKPNAPKSRGYHGITCGSVTAGPASFVTYIYQNNTNNALTNGVGTLSPSTACA